MIKQKTSASSLVFDPTRVTQLSWTPRFVKVLILMMILRAKYVTLCFCRVFLYKGFLSDEECDHFIKLVDSKKNIFFHLFISFRVVSELRKLCVCFRRKGSLRSQWLRIMTLVRA